MFSKKELLLFFFSWIQTFKRSFVIFIKYFWWLAAAEIVFKTKLFSFKNYQAIFMGLVTLLSMLSIYFSILAIRASIEVKDTHYFISRSKKMLGFSIISLPLFFILTTAIFFNTGLSSYNWALSTSLGGLNLIFQNIAAIILIISAMFLLDTRPTANVILAIKNTFLSVKNYFVEIFAIATLYGLLILIIRRLTNKRIYMVTSKMDGLVYLILFTQVLSGMWVAFFNSWGSVWFATTLTPYLRSLFTLSPEITAIAALPLGVKIHIISAYVLILIIPFTRFAHFLVYPFRYLIRNTQRVIWNWDRKTIRNADKMYKGVKAKNN